MAEIMRSEMIQSLVTKADDFCWDRTHHDADLDGSENGMLTFSFGNGTMKGHERTMLMNQSVEGCAIFKHSHT